MREWWTLREGDTFIILAGKDSMLNNYISTFSNDSLRNFKQKPVNYYPLLSIGQCIELLAEKDMIHLQSIFAKVSHGILSPDEILDALFDALKQVL